MEKYFYCYSFPLKEFLLECGENYIVKGIHPKTKKMYWVFKGGTKKFNKLLTKWKERKK